MSAHRVAILPSLDALLAQLDSRRAFKTDDSLSGSRFEAVRYHGEAMILKYLAVDDDWIMRATGDLHCRQLTLFASGLLDRVPRTIDHVVVAAAPYVTPAGHRGGAFLMRDVGDRLIPPGGSKIALTTHRRLLEHMAQLHATYWGWQDGDVFPLAHHYMILTPAMATLERQRGGADPVPRAVGDGWKKLIQLWPGEAATMQRLTEDPGPLVAALRATPQTLIHGDWKFGNLGEHEDGRTILLDWDRCGSGPATFDLAWYLAVNCDRLPEGKHETIAAYRLALEACGVDAAAWWDRQLALTLLGAFLMLGWSKTHDLDECAWWIERFREGVSQLAHD